MARPELFGWRGADEFAHVRAEEEPSSNPTTLRTRLLSMLKANAYAQCQQAPTF